MPAVVVAAADRVAELRIGPVETVPDARLAIQECVNKINEIIRKEPGTWTFRGDWLSTEQYKANDLVANDGELWLSLIDNLNEEPPSLSWHSIATGP